MPLPTLNDEQEAVFQGLLETLGCGESRVSLLSGVTGSGKTSIYAHLIAECLQQGKGAVLLVPEISLTPQMLARFSAWFGDEVAVMPPASAVTSGSVSSGALRALSSARAVRCLLPYRILV